MTITLAKLASSVVVLEKIKNQNPDFKVHYWIMRNIKILTDSYNFFIKNREDIYSKYCEKIISKDYPNGTYYTIIKDGPIKFNLKKGIDIQNFDKDVNELMTMECDDIEPYILSINTIMNNMDNIRIDGDDILAIDYLLSE